MSVDHERKEPEASKAEIMLQGIRLEMTRPVYSIQGHGRLLKKMIQSGAVAGIPEGFEESVDSIIEAGDQLQWIMDEITSTFK
jgi:hypothetical protein